MSTSAATILDQRKRPLRDLRISVTDRCNFRCGYCMPKDVFGRGYKFLRQNQLLSFEEIERLVNTFAQFGVTKLRLTGGEPLLRKDIHRLVSMLAQIDGIDDIAMTTNASLLSSARAIALRNAGLKRLNISLDALDTAINRKMNDVNAPLENVLSGIEHAINAGFESIKINMVVQKDVNHSDILPMVERFRNSGAVLRFIEFMDVGNHNAWSMDRVFTSKQTIDLIHQHYPLEAMDANYRGEVAKRWRFVDGAGEIGVISSITQPFCGSCARARLSAIGELFTCLFASSGFDLRSLLRAGYDDQVIAGQLAKIWRARDDCYSEMRFSPENLLVGYSRKNKVEMSYIGG